jgi:hypothetical protein
MASTTAEPTMEAETPYEPQSEYKVSEPSVPVQQSAIPVVNEPKPEERTLPSAEPVTMAPVPEQPAVEPEEKTLPSTEPVTMAPVPEQPAVEPEQTDVQPVQKAPAKPRSRSGRKGQTKPKEPESQPAGVA